MREKISNNDDDGKPSNIARLRFRLYNPRVTQGKETVRGAKG